MYLKVAASQTTINYTHSFPLVLLKKGSHLTLWPLTPPQPFSCSPARPPAPPGDQQHDPDGGEPQQQEAQHGPGGRGVGQEGLRRQPHGAAAPPAGRGQRPQLLPLTSLPGGEERQTVSPRMCFTTVIIHFITFAHMKVSGAGWQTPPSPPVLVASLNRYATFKWPFIMSFNSSWRLVCVFITNVILFPPKGSRLTCCRRVCFVLCFFLPFFYVISIASVQFFSSALRLDWHSWSM